MVDVIRLKKRSALIGVILITVVAFSVFAFGVFGYTGIETASETDGELQTAAFSCPAQTGTCTAGTWKCVEDLGTPATHACEYKCGTGGWGAGTECDFNMCEGSRCFQHSHSYELERHELEA